MSAKARGRVLLALSEEPVRHPALIEHLDPARRYVDGGRSAGRPVGISPGGSEATRHR